MADNFNMKKFLVENKLGAYSKLKEEKFYAPSYVAKKYGSKAKEIEDNIEDEKDNNPNIWDLYTSLETEKETDEFVKGFMNEGEAAYEYEKGKAAGEKEEKEKLKEYEVIYVVQNGKCYRITDEGYKDEVDMGYCRREGVYEEKEEKEEQFGGVNENDDDLGIFDDIEGDLINGDMDDSEAVEYLQDIIAFCKKKMKEIQSGELNENTIRDSFLSPEAINRMDGLVSQTALKALIGGAQAIIRDFKQEGFEDEEIFEFIMLKIKTLE